MIKENYIPLLTFCTCYNVEMDFLYDLSENGLLEITYLEQEACIHQDLVWRLEKILRLHEELQINIAGIDAVFNLLNQVEDLQMKVQRLSSKIKIYES